MPPDSSSGSHPDAPPHTRHDAARRHVSPRDTAHPPTARSACASVAP